MNLTQNDRLNQVTAETLVVGVDIGSQEHFARAFDWRGFEFSKRTFRFSNTNVGFLSFLRWLEEMAAKAGMKKIIVGCEPTGCYWLTFQKFLQGHDILPVTVNPYSVKRSKELDDNSPEKSDLKDPKTIAGLVKRRAFFNFIFTRRHIRRDKGSIGMQGSDHETACASVKPDTGMAPEVFSGIL